MNYKSEEEFLKAYNPEDFDRLSVTTDILVFSVSDISQDNYRKTNEKVLSILLVKRDDYPFKDKLCIPGGFVRIDEDLEDAPKRILQNETNLKDIYMEQLYTFGKVNRDPRMRIVSTAYLSLIDKNMLHDKLNDNTKWYDIRYDEKQNGGIVLTLSANDEEYKIKAKKKIIEKTTGRYSYEIIENSDLAFDHAEVILYGIERLRNKIEYTDIVFNMMPKYFTLGELQKVYEVILGKKLLDAAFRRTINKKIIKSEKMIVDGGHRPSALFMYKEQ